MNNNQQNQAMGVLGGLTGFAVVANMADGTSVIAALVAMDTAVNAIKGKIGNGALPLAATDIVDALTKLDSKDGVLSNLTTVQKGNLVAAINELVTALGTTNGVVSGHTRVIATLPTVAFKFVKGDTGGSVTAGSATDTLDIVGDGVIATTYNGGKIKIDSSALPHVSISDILGDNNSTIRIDNSADRLKVYGSNGIETKADDTDHTLTIDGAALSGNIGDLSQLKTVTKASLVDAINEIYGML